MTGVHKEHSELTMYPHRGDSQGFFETFMTTISGLVDEIGPAEPGSTVGSPSQHSDDASSWRMAEIMKGRNASSLSFDSLSRKCSKVDLMI